MNKNEYVSYFLEDIEELLVDNAKSFYNISAAKTYDDDKSPILLVGYPNSAMRAYEIPYIKRDIKNANDYRDILTIYRDKIRDLKTNIILDIENYENTLDNVNNFRNTPTNVENTEIAEEIPRTRLHSDEYYEEYDTDYYSEFIDIVKDWIRDYEVEHNCHIDDGDYGALYNDYNNNDDSFLETMLSNLDKFNITYNTVSEDRQEEFDNAVQDLTSTEEQESENPLDTDERIVLNHTEDYYEDFDPYDFEEFKDVVNDYIEDYNKTVSEDKKVQRESISEFILEDLYENDYLDEPLSFYHSFLEVMEDNIGKIDFEAIERHNLIPDENEYIPHHTIDYYEDYDTDYLDEFIETAKEWIEDYEHLNSVTIIIDDEEFEDLNAIYQDNDYSFNATMLDNMGKVFYVINHPEEYYNRLDGLISNKEHFEKNAKEWINDNFKYLVILSKSDIDNIDYSEIYNNYCNNGISFVDTMLNSMINYDYLIEDPREGMVFTQPISHIVTQQNTINETVSTNRRTPQELRELYNQAKDFENVRNNLEKFLLTDEDRTNNNIYENSDGFGYRIIFDDNTKLKVPKSMITKWIDDYGIDYIEENLFNKSFECQDNDEISLD